MVNLDEKAIPEVISASSERVRKAKTRKRYNRIAWLYDLIEAPSEWLFFRRWRRELFARVPRGVRLLEVGVGTGKNLPYYPEGIRATAIDLSERMLARARRKPAAAGVELRWMDVQSLDFPDESFDVVVGTFVFCSVPNPVLGLSEIRRVLKPGGKLLLLEHVRPENRWLGGLFDLLNPLVVRIMGANINRETEQNLQRAGWTLQQKDILSTIFRRFVAVARTTAANEDEST